MSTLSTAHDDHYFDGGEGLGETKGLGICMYFVFTQKVGPLWVGTPDEILMRCIYL